MRNKELLKEMASKNPHLMLDELYREISKKYGISLETIMGLVSSETEKSLSGLKKELKETKNSQGDKLSSSQIEELLTVIEGAKKVRKSLVQEIQLLKEEIGIGFQCIDDNQIIKKLLPKNLIFRVENPQNISDHVTGILVGLLNSTETVIQILYEIGKGIILTPTHIYMIVSGKGKYEKWKEI